MLKKKMIILVLLFVLLLGAVILLGKPKTLTQEKSASKTQSDQLETDHSLESTTGGSSNFIENLRKREFKGGKIKIEETLSQSGSHTSYLISYPSDNLKIYGVMDIPNGDGPFPVIVLNHGYYSPSEFKSGDGTINIADILSSQGYITLASDYRGNGNSQNDSGNRGGHRPEYAIDVLNLLASIKNIPKADTSRIGMWGHSMGGEVSLRTLEATKAVKATVLWAPTSGNAADNQAFYNGKHTQASTPALNGASPINYLQYITSPISIHQGLTDTEVKPEWSKELKNALKNKGKTVEYFEYEGQDHNFRNLGWDLISERTLNFYNKYLK